MCSFVIFSIFIQCTTITVSVLDVFAMAEECPGATSRLFLADANLSVLCVDLPFWTFCLSEVI